MPKRWPYKIKAEAKRLRQLGTSISDIAKQTGVPYRTVEHWLAQERLARTAKGLPAEERPPRSDKWPQEVVQRCLDLHAQGLPYREIMRLTGVPDSTQRGWAPKPVDAPVKVRRRSTSAAEGETMMRKNGLVYKIGVHGKLFYLSAQDEWRRSSLSPAEVGFLS
jgi:transposase